MCSRPRSCGEPRASQRGRGGLFVVVAFTVACAGCAAGAGGVSGGQGPPGGTVGLAAPGADRLLQQERRIIEAWMAGDVGALRLHLADIFLDFKMGARVAKMDLLSMVSGYRCEVRRWQLGDAAVAPMSENVSVLTYKGSFDGGCTGADGKLVRLLSPVRSASVYVRTGGEWLGAFHSENWMDDGRPRSGGVDRTALPPGTTSSSESPAVAEFKVLTLSRLHMRITQAAARRERKTLSQWLLAQAGVITRSGVLLSGRDAVLRRWPDTLFCKAAPAGASVLGRAFDGVAEELSPGVALLTLRTSACPGADRADAYHAALYVETRQGWRLGFLIESSSN